MRLLVNEWSKYIKSKTWVLPDNVSFGQVNHLIDALNSVCQVKTPKIDNQSRQTLPMGFHFLFNNQSNNMLGRDWYDNYQAPCNLQTGDGLFSRRMWVKGSIVNSRFLPNIGDNVSCEERVSSVRYLGGYALVNIQRQFYKEDILSFEESRTLIYTNEKYTANEPKPVVDSANDDITSIIRLSAQDVFKYSMLTYNLHKIHYDRQYCQQVENFSDVIVQGPFMVTLLLHWFGNVHNTTNFKSFNYKNIEPCFVEQNLKLCCKKVDTNNYRLRILNEEASRVYIEGNISI